MRAPRDNSPIQLPFPLKGLDTVTGLTLPRKLTGIRLRNVRAYEPSTQRNRGASRCGVSQHTPRAEDSWVQVIRCFTTQQEVASCVFSCDTVSNLGSLAGFFKYGWPVIAGNGCIYCPPYWASGVLKIDPSTDGVSTFGSLGIGEQDKYFGAVLAGNGCIYSPPFTNRTKVLKIDPTDDSLGEFGSITGGGYYEPMLASNGKIYAAPASAAPDGILKIDPSDDSVSILGSVGTGTSNRWPHPGIEVNGAIYWAPFRATAVLKLDLGDESVSTFGSLGTDFKWRYAALGNNSKIYAVPWDAEQVLKIDPATDTASLIGSTISGFEKWRYCFKASTGAIYGIPDTATTVLKIDPATDAVSEIGSLTHNDDLAYYGADVACDGKIYSIPLDPGPILRIDPATDTVEELCDLGSDTDKWHATIKAGNDRMYGIPSSDLSVVRIF